MQTVILAGGLGTRLAEETGIRPKPMVEIGDRPILRHIMELYDAHGFGDFVIALGYLGDMVKRYFVDWTTLSGDLEIDLAGGSVGHSHRAPHDWHLVLAGSTGFGAEEILREIETSPRRANIHLPGYVGSKQLEGLYRAASMLAFPSLDEGFGLPILEAMAWGVPVVTSNRSALPEAAGDAAIQVNPEDVDELAFAMRTLAENDGLRKSLIVAGLARAAEFSWRKAVEATWSVYKELNH